jgi:hypothetical protein
MPHLQWDPEFNLGNVLTALGLFFTGATVLFAGIGLQRSVRTQRAEFLLKLTQRYFEDNEVRRLYYQVDWETQPLNLGGGSDDERRLDRLLYLYDEIGEVLRLRVLNKEQASVFAFQAVRVLRNSYVRDYMKMVDGDYRAEGLIQSHAGARYLVTSILGKTALEPADPKLQEMVTSGAPLAGSNENVPVRDPGS